MDFEVVSYVGVSGGTENILWPVMGEYTVMVDELADLHPLVSILATRIRT